MGWKILFDRFDDDRSGSLDGREFIEACREEMGLTEAEVSDAELNAIFKQVDADGGGDISSDEFSSWLASDSSNSGDADAENDAKVPTPVNMYT